MTRSLMSLWQLKNEDTEVWNDMFVLFSGGGHVFCGVFRLMEDRWFFNAQSSLRTPLQANCQTAGNPINEHQRQLCRIRTKDAPP